MPRRLLSAPEIGEFVVLLKDVFAYISRLKETNPLARDIQFPKLPPKLTESIAIHLLQDGLIPQLKGFDFHFGGNEADIVASRGAERLRIEVKGTTRGFEYFGEKDIKANYLMWFDFEDLFRKGKNHFTLCVLPYKESRFSKPVKITLAGLRKIEGNDLQWSKYDIQDFVQKLT